MEGKNKVGTLCRWVLLPPKMARRVAKGKLVRHRGEDDEVCTASFMTQSVYNDIYIYFSLILIISLNIL